MEEVITCTPNALFFLKNSVEHEKCLGIKISIVPGGCSGMTYEVNFVKEINNSDLVTEQDGLKIFVEPKAVLFVSGMVLDYVTTPMGGSLVFQNPNARSQCGCGKSFSLDSSPCSGSCSECQS